MMEEILELIRVFETRNNISITIQVHGDGSSSIKEFWDNDVINECKKLDELKCFLSSGSVEGNYVPIPNYSLPKQKLNLKNNIDISNCHYIVAKYIPAIVKYILNKTSPPINNQELIEFSQEIGKLIIKKNEPVNLN
jgi:hypothetical protein